MGERFNEQIDAVMGRALAAETEVRRLRAELAALQQREEQAVADRDEAHDWADRIAHAVAPVGELGEHTSENNPWAAAIEAAKRLRRRVAELEVALEPNVARRLELAQKLAVSSSNLLRIERDDARRRVAELETDAVALEDRVAELEAVAAVDVPPARAARLLYDDDRGAARAHHEATDRRSPPNATPDVALAGDR